MRKNTLCILLLATAVFISFSQKVRCSQIDLFDSSVIQSLPTLQLQAEVDKLLGSNDPVDIRHKIHIVWELVDRLKREKNKTDELMRYLEQGLRHNAWNLKYQLDYAMLLKEKGKTKEAQERAEIIATYSEKDELIDAASEILKKPKLPSIPFRKVLDGKEHTIILVPVGKVDVWLLFELQKKLQEVLKIKVEIQDFHISAPKYTRDHRDIIIEDIRERLIKQSESPDISRLLKDMSINKSDLENDEVVIKIVNRINELTAGKEAVDSFNKLLEDSIGKDRQWHIDALYSKVVEQTGNEKKPKLKYLGICNLDTYATGTNFLFGTASSKGYGIISYRRFSAEFNEEPPNRTRLLDRTLKQALSSLGFMYNIERCSIPTCPRTYPNNLKEHDAKGTELCSKCKEAFEKALK